MTVLVGLQQSNQDNRQSSKKNNKHQYLPMMRRNTPETCTGWRNILIIVCSSSWFFFTRLYQDARSTKQTKNVKYIHTYIYIYIYIHISITKIILQRWYFETRIFQRRTFFYAHFQAFCHVNTSTLNFPYNPQCIWQHSKQHSM